VGYVASVGDMRNAYKILVGKPEGSRPFGRYRRGSRNEVAWEGMD